MSEASAMDLSETLYFVDVSCGHIRTYRVGPDGRLHENGNMSSEEGMRREGLNITYDLKRIPSARRQRLLQDGEKLVLPIGTVCSKPTFCDDAFWTWSHENAKNVSDGCRTAAERTRRAMLDAGLR